MRTPEFKTDQMQWDEFKKFHNNLNGGLFVKFDDGGFMIRNRTLRPDRRKTYDKYGFRIMRSNDLRGLRFMTPDGERVTAKSLQNCELLWDLDTNKAYSLTSLWIVSKYNRKEARYEIAYEGPQTVDLVPHYLQKRTSGIKFFMYGDGRIVSMPVHMSVPKKFNDEEEEYIKTITAACKAWHHMVETKENRWRFSKQYLDRLNWRGFNDLTEPERRGVAMFGLDRPSESKYVSHLIIERKNNA